MAGDYFVLDAASGAVVKRIPVGEPIFSAPVVGTDRVYFATLGSRVHAVTPQGEILWIWDYVREALGFDGDRWSGADWRRLKGQATWREQFCCSRDIALHERTLVIPAGGAIVWLDDAGDRAVPRGDLLGAAGEPRHARAELGRDGQRLSPMDAARQLRQRGSAAA